MKLTNKMMLVAGIIFQLTANLYADNWSNAFLAFGGGKDPVVAAQAVLNGPGSLTASNALTIANSLKTPEALAIGRYLAMNKKNVFNSSFQDADVQAAAQSLIATRMNNQPISSGPIVAPAPVNTPPSSGGWSDWLSGSSSAACPDNSAAIQQAVLAQQKADAAVAVANTQALAAIANSNASGAALYNAYIDLIFSSLAQAIAGIADQAVQQQVVQYAQNKLASMKAAASANSYNSRILGKSSSKKEAKKNKRSRAHAAR